MSSFFSKHSSGSIGVDPGDDRHGTGVDDPETMDMFDSKSVV